MTDIIERLRAEVDHDVNEPLDRLLDQAADEIERLRTALEVSLDYVECTEEEKELIRGQIREGNRLALEAAMKRGIKVHPRLGTPSTLTVGK